MNVTYHCATCDQGARVDFDDCSPELICPNCKGRVAIARGAVQDNRVTRCLACPSHDLYVRKDFPQRVGVGLVALGIVGSSIAWYHMNVLWTFGILFATALADLLLYLLVGDAVMCYRCHAQYRGVEETDAYGSFDLETHEKYRQLAARMPPPSNSNKTA